MIAPTAHIDTFAQESLPPPDSWPELRLSLPELQYPPRLNAARVLLDEAIDEGFGTRAALWEGSRLWTYRELLDASTRIAHVLVAAEGLVPGNRVLLMGPNSRMLAAAWLAVLRAGGIAVTAMPLLRANELVPIAVKARIDHVLADARHLDELRTAARETGLLRRLRSWGSGDLESAMEAYPAPFEPVDTAVDDV